MQNRFHRTHAGASVGCGVESHKLKATLSDHSGRQWPESIDQVTHGRMGVLWGASLHRRARCGRAKCGKKSEMTVVVNNYLRKKRQIYDNPHRLLSIGFLHKKNWVRGAASKFVRARAHRCGPTRRSCASPGGFQSNKNT